MAIARCGFAYDIRPGGCPSALRWTTTGGTDRHHRGLETSQSPVLVVEVRALDERWEVVRVAHVLRRRLRHDAAREREHLALLLRDHVREQLLDRGHGRDRRSRPAAPATGGACRHRLAASGDDG